MAANAFDDALAASSDEALERAALETKVAETRRQRDSLSLALKKEEALTADLSKRLNLVEQITDLNPKPPKWLTPRRKASSHHATVCTILSDSHFDEVVNPDEIGGVNAYDRDIAEQRLRRYFNQVIDVSRNYMAGVTFDGAVCMLGGDLISGDIHEELSQSNEDSVLATVLHWSELVTAGIAQLADEFGHVHVPVVVGNHGRRTRKPRAKGRAHDNFDWMIGMLIARYLKDDPRVTFDIPEAAHTHFDVYSTTYHLEHGDSATGGSGWMGPKGPAMRREQKVSSVQQAINQPFDHMVIGHWHTLSWLGRIITNGSSKGYDEYAMINSFSFEPPQQAMWLTTPEHGITMQAPVLVQDRKAEKW